MGSLVLNTGVTFPTSSGGGTVTSDTLLHFEQGTFTPTIRGSGTAGTITYLVQEGRYQKVGRVVTMSIVVEWTTIGGATGAIQITNLPYTTLATTGASAVPSLVVGWVSQLATASGGVPFIQGNQNGTTANIDYYLGSSGFNVATTITASNSFMVQYTYETV
jgi:hypothetical protein